MLVLRYMLKRYHTEYMFQKRITYNQHDDWNELYKAYVALGGNSLAETWDKDIKNLEKRDSLAEMSPFEMLLKQRDNEEKNNK